MAEQVRIVLFAPSREIADRAADAAYARFRELNAIMSDYDPQSEVRRLSATSGQGKAVRVSDDLWRVLSAAKALSERSGGAFDVTVGPVVRLWRRARRQHVLPSPERLAEARRAVGYQHMRLDPRQQTVELLRPGMWIDLGGIATGDALDQAFDALKKHGVTRAMIDAGGDILLGDPPPGKPGWTIGVGTLDPEARPAAFVVLSRAAIVNSGDSVQYVQIGGRRYSHLVDPRSGMALTDHSNVTVTAPNGMTADGLSTAVSVMEPEQGLKLIEATPGAAAFILRAPWGKVEAYQSRGWKTLLTLEAFEARETSSERGSRFSAKTASGRLPAPISSPPPSPDQPR
jgi:thiamine biosynthesis lipoprotein